MNPLTRFAALLTRTTPQLSPSIEGENSYRKVLLAVARPVGELLSDDFENVKEVFDFLVNEEILTKEESSLLLADKEFCDALEKGLSSDDYDDDEDDDYDNDNKDDEEEEENGWDDNYRWDDNYQYPHLR